MSAALTAQRGPWKWYEGGGKPTGPPPPPYKTINITWPFVSAKVGSNRTKMEVLMSMNKRIFGLY